MSQSSAVEGDQNRLNRMHIQIAHLIVRVDRLEADASRDLTAKTLRCLAARVEKLERWVSLGGPAKTPDDAPTTEMQRQAVALRGLGFATTKELLAELAERLGEEL